MEPLILEGADDVIGLDGPRDIVIEGDSITHVGTEYRGAGRVISCANAIAFPGLINSHDHLEFNCYTPLGTGPYGDYVAWGEDIHARDHATIAAIEAIPYATRFRWGVAKQLLCGVTSVAQHGHGPIPPEDFPMEIIRTGRTIHSVRLEHGWRLRMLLPPNQEPYVIHVNEGVTDAVRTELDAVRRWNPWKRAVIGVHGVSATTAQAARLAALVWCPVSNDFLYGRTAAIDALKRATTILFGTDATISAGWNIWDHLRHARRLGMLTDEELFHAVTDVAARVWGLSGRGRIEPGSSADIVVARRHNGRGLDAWFSIQPEDILLVVHRGRIVLIDAALVDDVDVAALHPVHVGSARKYTAIDIPRLYKEISALLPPEIPRATFGLFDGSVHP